MIIRITSILQILSSCPGFLIYFERAAKDFRTAREISPQNKSLRLELDGKTPDSHRG